MSEKLLSTIHTEVAAHEAGIGEIHIQTITNEIYKQLRELLPEEQLEIIATNMSGQFKKIVDALIPIVEDYEERIDAELNIQIANLLDSIKEK